MARYSTATMPGADADHRKTAAQPASTSRREQSSRRHRLFCPRLSSRQRLLRCLIFGVALLGLCLTCIGLRPLGSTPDFWAHTYRVSAIFNGEPVAHPVSSLSRFHHTPGTTVGGDVDADIVRLSVQQPGEDVQTGVIGSSLPKGAIADTTGNARTGTIAVPFNNTAVYSPLAYLPQMIGLGLGSALGLAASARLVCMEIVMAVVFCALSTAALWVLRDDLPERLALTAAVLFPLSWWPYSFAVSADSLSLALGLFFAAACAAGLRHPDRHGLPAAAAVSGFLLATGKFSAAPLLLISLGLLFSHRNQASPANGRARIRDHVWILGAFLAAILADLLWLRFGTSGYATCPSLVSAAEAHEREIFLLTHPFSLLRRIGWSLLHHQNAYLAGPAAWCFWIAGAALFICLLVVTIRRGDSHSQMSGLPFWWTTAVAILLWALLEYAAVWVSYNPATTAGIDGMQYRYFLPAMPWFLLLIAALISQRLSVQSSESFGYHGQPPLPR